MRRVGISFEMVSAENVREKRADDREDETDAETDQIDLGEVHNRASSYRACEQRARPQRYGFKMDDDASFRGCLRGDLGVTMAARRSELIARRPFTVCRVSPHFTSTGVLFPRMPRANDRCSACCGMISS